ncbi:hypothetical protein [Hamadaea tsunoensis]|uniref:hypothetical protein n=1 Tax=Hamadaea tsunoensis TaxID=53368 RepID=UPI00048254A9|nr:hypothetical protein [Hamadaea tsunoensis]
MRARQVWVEAAISLLGLGLLWIIVRYADAVVCPPSAACRSDYLGAVALACLVGVVIVSWFHPFVAAGAAVAGAGAALAAGRTEAAPGWAYVVLCGYALLVGILAYAWRGRPGRIGGPRAAVPGRFTVPRFTLATAASGALLALALATLVFGAVRQSRSTGTDPSAPVTMAAPVYDTAVWVLFFTAVLLAIVGLAVAARTLDRRREWRRLARTPQPETPVWYASAHRALYAGDPEPGDAPFAGVSLDLAGTVPLILYGRPEPGALCAVVLDDGTHVRRLRTPPRDTVWTATPAATE